MKRVKKRDPSEGFQFYQWLLKDLYETACKFNIMHKVVNGFEAPLLPAELLRSAKMGRATQAGEISRRIAVASKIMSAQSLISQLTDQSLDAGTRSKNGKELEQIVNELGQMLLEPDRTNKLQVLESNHLADKKRLLVENLKMNPGEANQVVADWAGTSVAALEKRLLPSRRKRSSTKS
jgi:hypothetical protein